MSASTGPSSKGEKGKFKYQSLDINSIYNSTRSEASEAQTTKSTILRKHGMQPLGKVPQRRPPANLPSLKSENSGNDPSISLVPSGVQGWGVKPGESQQLTPAVGGGGNSTVTQNNQTTVGHPVQNTVQSSPVPAVGATPAPTQPSGPPLGSQQSSQDKTWSSVTGGSQAGGLGAEHGPSFLAHQSPQFRQEFPSLSGEPGGAPAHPVPAYGPGPSLRPQTEPTSWSQGTHAKPIANTQPTNTTTPPNMNSQFKSVVPPFLMSQGGGIPMFPENIQKRSRSQAAHSENRINRTRMAGMGQNAGRGPPGGGNQNNAGSTGEGEDLVLSRPIIREEELVKMDELTRDPSWAANDDIDYNEQLSFSDGESVGEDEKEKENKLRDKSKQQAPIRDDKKEDLEKSNRDKSFMSERDRNQQPWRLGNNAYSDYRNADRNCRQLLPGGGRMDEEEIWKERRRQTNEHKIAAAEKARKRKEEEEKRYEEEKAKKSNKDVPDFHSPISSSFSDWDKEKRAESSETFRQMIQFPPESRTNMNRDRDNMNRDRDMRRDRDNQFNQRCQNKPPRFRQKEQTKMQQFGGGGSGGGGGGGFEKNWSNHNSFGRRGGPDPMDKDNDDFRKDRHDRPSPSNSAPDRFRMNVREERNMDSNKRNYYDSVHMDYNQSSFQSSRESDKDKDLNKDYDYRMSDKESCGREDKEWEQPKGDSEQQRGFDDRMRRDNKPINDNYSKQQSNDHFDDKDNEWRERLQRPESRDKPERLDNRERPDRDPRPTEHRSENRLESNRLEPRESNRLDRQDSRDSTSRQDYRHDTRADSQDNVRDRPSRPDSRDSRASRDSRTSKESASEKLLLETDYSLQESYLQDKMERLCFKEKEMRRDPIPRGRDHVPGPITQDKLVAYEHKHSQSQMEKCDSQEKESEDKKMKKGHEVESVSQAWGDSREEKPSLIQEAVSSTQDSSSRTGVSMDFGVDDSKGLNKNDDLDKRKENGGGMRDRRDDNKSLGGGNRGGNRNRGGARTSNYNTGGSKYNMYSSGGSTNWQNNKDRQRQGSSRGRAKHWNQSDSDGSGDEISPESGKDDKKTDNRKQDCKFGTWKSDNKDRRDDKKEMKIGGDSDKERTKGDKKSDGRGGNMGDGARKGGDGGFAPRPTGEPSRRGRGGSSMRGQTRLGMGSAMYGPPGSKPFGGSSGQQQPNAPSGLGLDPQDKQFSPPQQSEISSWGYVAGRKDDGQSGGKGEKTPRGKAGGVRSQDDNWETTSETSDGSDAKKSNKMRNKSDRKSRGAVGDKRNLVNSGGGSAHLNGRPDTKPEDLEKKTNKDDSETTPYSNNGFQEVKSKKTGREGRSGPGIIKEEVKRSRSKGKEKTCPGGPGGGGGISVGGGGPGTTGSGGGASGGGGGGVKSQQKSYTREFVNNKPPRMQRLDSRKQQQQQLPTHDVTDMNKINQSVTSLFPSRSGDVGSNSCPPPPAHNAWNKPINAALRTTPPLSTTLTQLTAAPAQITTDKPNLEDLSQPTNAVPASSPTADKAIAKMSREAVEKSIMEGPPVNTIIFENTNYKRDPGDIGMKQRYPMNKPTRTPLDKTRDRKIEDELAEGNHSMSLGGFKPASELQTGEGKPQDNIQVPISFGKNEDNADMKLDFAFDSDLSQLSDDKNNQSMHVGQSGAADLNQKIASVKKVWDSPPSISSHVDENASSGFTQGFSSDKTLDPTAPSHHSDHSDFNTPDSVYGSGQLSGASAYVATGSSMMKQDTIVSNTNTMCKTNMFQVSPQAQQVTVMPHPGPLSTPPPIPNVLSFQPGFSSNLSAVPSPPNVMYNSQQAGGPQTEIYQTYSLSTAQMHGSGNRSYADFPPPSYNMSQNSTFQPNVYVQSAPPSQSVFQNPTQFRIPPVKSSQGSMQPTAIGSKSGGGPPTATFPPPPSPQILLIEPPAVGFLHQGYHRPASIQHSSSYFPTNSSLAPGGSSGGLFNSAALLSGGGGGANTGSLPSGSPFNVQPPTAASYSQQQQPPSSTQPPTHHQQQPYPTQPQMGGSFRSQAGFPKSGQHPTDMSKSSSSDQFQSIFHSSAQGSPKPRVGLVKPQPQHSGSPQPQQLKFPYNTNPHSVSQSNLAYQQSNPSNGSSRQSQAQQVIRGGGSVGGVVPQQATRYVSPIQRPMATSTYSQHQAQAMLQQQARQQQQQQHRNMLQAHQSRQSNQQQQSSGPQQQKQYYQQQGGGMKLEGSDSVKSEVEDQGKVSQDKCSKDESSSDQ